MLYQNVFRKKTLFQASLLKIFICLFFIFSATNLFAQQRIVSSINTNWQFHKGEVANTGDKSVGWENVSLPHTWNATDVMDDEPGYYRGVGWYKKTLFIDNSWKNKDVYIFFEAANQIAEIFLNGKKVGSHTGGYNFFSFKINDFIQLNDGAGVTANEITVRVDNAHNENVPPLGADFTFYGGIYRDVYLIAADRVHFDMDNYASKGVFVSTPSVSAEKANVLIKGAFINNNAKAKKLVVRSVIKDAEGKIIASKETAFKSKTAGTNAFEQKIDNISQPKLWSPESPYVYNVVTTLIDKETNQQVDEVVNALGFRWFSFDANSGFFLNGKHMKLVGANRHQDYPGMGNAISDAMNIKDIELMKQMGANFIRIAHYPQDPTILETCDRLGIMASVEIPIVNRITDSDAFYNNCKQMQVEMIRQSYNHPSVIIWAYMNEVMIAPRYGDKTPERDAYFKTLAKFAQQLEDLTRKEDSTRYTMIPFYGNFDVHYKYGLTKIPMVVGWNLYQGWYGADINGFDAFLERHHKEVADKPVIISEYGADVDARLHDFTPVRFDKTAEYGNYYHEHYFKAMMDRPFVAGMALWNFVEFNAEARTETNPHMNMKGIVSATREPKDVYWYYQSHLLQTPVIKIGSRNWTLRSATATDDNDSYCSQPVEIYTNQNEIEVLLNGKSLGKVKPDFGVAKINVPFANGNNKLEAISAEKSVTEKDVVDVQFTLLPKKLNSTKMPFSDIHVSLGDERYFTDTKDNIVWQPEQAYSAGSWGYIGGHVFKLKGNDRLPYGSDRNIIGTDHDALFETQRVGIEQFKLDVPDGAYEVTLHFAELSTDKQAEKLVYNLDKNAGETATAEQRAFDVLVNNIPVINGLSNTNYLLPITAYSTKTKISANNNGGITVSFKAVKGETILNGIEVRRVY
ncbi:glycoside hydrolase family 2 TIM barrel-domain containing protein [Pinibacter aurantiacus]|uniref:DUF4982 domain-containing protein n=1 Tax=Pinibacter aurantiacus TaxID=2851599 RepID=A0A9E2W7Y8_9BACT|nr:glycoside hydrolase family 2 TIM barrel-domain containing protein [Pinibacter aurantiacus]MBV4357137.1 DUF4982 domain-containing protein [Pinibacter aurantiacus]